MLVPVGPDGLLRGQWKGVDFTVAFSSTRDAQKRHFRHSNIRAILDPPLGVEGVERNVYFDRIVDAAFRADVAARARRIGFADLSFGDGHIGGSFKERESVLFATELQGPSFDHPDVRNAALELLVWAAHAVQARRAANPPPWERAIAEAWPSLAQGWGMQLDGRRCEIAGVVRGRPTRVQVVNRGGGLMTCAEVAVPLPPGCSLSLARQLEGGFFDEIFGSLVGGGDINLGDAAFDAAFLVKGGPESFVRDALTPAARVQLMELASAGASVTFENGRLTVWARRALVNREDLDPFMKAAFSAAATLGSPPPVAPAPTPYR